MTALRVAGLTVLAAAAAGCTVITVAGAAVSVGAAVVGTAVDVTVGAAKITGRAVGSAIDAVGTSEEGEPPAGATPEQAPAETPKQP